MNAKIYIEGGGDSKELHSRCREGFRHLLEHCGFTGRMPRLVACGGRQAAFDDFSIACESAGEGEFVALLIDSEDPLEVVEATWNHLHQRDHWRQPDGARDEQVLLMTTCMETWLVADRQALRAHFGQCLHENSLPSQTNLESRTRSDVQGALVQATRGCKQGYAKGKCSFALLARLRPAELRRHLPSFARFERILREELQNPKTIA